jgi:hypothetical protein
VIGVPGQLVYQHINAYHEQFHVPDLNQLTNTWWAQAKPAKLQ